MLTDTGVSVPSSARPAGAADDSGKTYRTPDLVLIAPAKKLLKGNQPNGPYRDCSNSGYTGWPQNC